MIFVEKKKLKFSLNASKYLSKTYGSAKLVASSWCDVVKLIRPNLNRVDPKRYILYIKGSLKF